MVDMVRAAEIGGERGAIFPGTGRKITHSYRAHSWQSLRPSAHLFMPMKMAKTQNSHLTDVIESMSWPVPVFVQLFTTHLVPFR